MFKSAASKGYKDHAKTKNRTIQQEAAPEDERAGDGLTNARRRNRDDEDDDHEHVVGQAFETVNDPEDLRDIPVHAVDARPVPAAARRRTWGCVVTREERKNRANKRRLDILTRLAEIAAHTINSGGSVRDAISAADKWAWSEVQRQPQEKAMYVSAAREYARLLAEWSRSIANEKVEAPK